MKKYRIVCYYPSGVWVVQEPIQNGWMEAHRCEARDEEGYKEAKKWINEEEKQQ